MSRNLEFFHGTNRRFAPGDLVLPPHLTKAQEVTRAEYGDDWYSEMGENDHTRQAFVSTDASEAHAYAQRAVKHLGGEPKVYSVEPINPEDVEHQEFGEHSSPTGFRVQGEVPSFVIEEHRKKFLRGLE